MFDQILRNGKLFSTPSCISYDIPKMLFRPLLLSDPPSLAILCPSINEAVIFVDGKSVRVSDPKTNVICVARKTAKLILFSLLSSPPDALPPKCWNTSQVFCCWDHCLHHVDNLPPSATPCPAWFLCVKPIAFVYYSIANFKKEISEHACTDKNTCDGWGWFVRSRDTIKKNLNFISCLNPLLNQLPAVAKK